MESLIEVRRAGFEAWYVTDCLNTAQIVITQEEVSKLRGKHGDYRERAALHGKWVGYNAALDSVVVGLPKEVAAGRWADDIGYFKDDIIEAIHAAGVKTK